MGKSKVIRTRHGMALLTAALGLLGTSPGFAQSGAWTKKANLPTARAAPASAVVNGKIYVIGGHDENFLSLATTEEYDPTTNTWTKKAKMPTPRNGLSACAVDGKIYVFGGAAEGVFLKTVEEYDPATDTWKSRADMPTARGGLRCIAVGGKIYALGGAIVEGIRIVTLSVVEEYDPQTNTWATKKNMPVGRSDFAVGEVNGQIYVMGGFVASGAPGAVHAYNPATDTWTTVNSLLPTPRSQISASTVNGIIYVIGGQSSAGATLATVEAFDPESNSWTTMAPMPSPRLDLATSSVNGKIYAIGGVQVSAPFVTVVSATEEFNPSGITSVEAPADRVPASFALYQNYPNPFNPETTIQYEISNHAHVVLKVLNLLGEEVRTLIDADQSPGLYEVRWDGKDNDGQDVASGMYLYRLKSRDFVQVRKMVLSR